MGRQARAKDQRRRGAHAAPSLLVNTEAAIRLLGTTIEVAEVCLQGLSGERVISDDERQQLRTALAGLKVSLAQARADAAVLRQRLAE